MKYKMHKKGDIVTVYDDPYTEQKPPGLVKKIKTPAHANKKKD